MVTTSWTIEKIRHFCANLPTFYPFPILNKPKIGKGNIFANCPLYFSNRCPPTFPLFVPISPSLLFCPPPPLLFIRKLTC